MTSRRVVFDFASSDAPSEVPVHSNTARANAIARRVPDAIAAHVRFRSLIRAGGY